MVMNRLTYAVLHKVGWEQLPGEVGNFVAIYHGKYICLSKIIETELALTKLLQK